MFFCIFDLAVENECQDCQESWLAWLECCGSSAPWCGNMPDFLGVLGSILPCDIDFGCHELICREERNFSRLELLSWDTRMCQRSVVKLGEPKRSVQIAKRGRRNDMGLPS